MKHTNLHAGKIVNFVLTANKLILSAFIFNCFMLRNICCNMCCDTSECSLIVGVLNEKAEVISQQVV